MPPKFSIIMPTYNQAQYVGAALDSLRAQTVHDWEAVVVNDGSTDTTAAVLAGYAARDGRIRIIEQPNGGTGAALNTALAHVRGDWVCWLSSDDLFDPRKLEVHHEWIAEHPDCRFFFTLFRLLRQSSGQMEDRDLWGPLPLAQHQVPGMFHRNYVSGISICVHRQSWEQVGRFNADYRYAQDYDMWLRLLQRHPAVFIPERTCISRNHDAQGSETFPHACYYDTAKSAINFINAHPFAQWFPAIDLGDESRAVAAVEFALGLATDPTSCVYFLGPHPAMLLRIMEWVWPADGAGGGHAPRIEKLVGKRLKAAARKHAHGQFGQVLKATLAEIRRPQPAIVYPGFVAAEIGREYHRYDPPDREPLARYLRQFEGITVDFECSRHRAPCNHGRCAEGDGTRRVPTTFHRTLQGTHRLAGRCRRVAARVYHAVRRRLP